MKSVIATAAAVLSLTLSTAATISKPFYLTIESQNKTLNGEKFGTCHEGAGIESLCVYPNDTQTFFYNHTGSNTYGSLEFYLPVNGGGQKIPSAYQFDPAILSTNVLHGQFYLGGPSYESAELAFDASNRLYAPVSYDDSVVPASFDKPSKLYNWFVCETNFEGYLYQTLNWVVGRPTAQSPLKPTNPTCQKVNVKRVFA